MPINKILKRATLSFEMEIHTIQEQIRQGTYEISFHAEKEHYAEDISLADIETTFSTERSWKTIPMTHEEQVA